jgi:hypothetical protein
MKNENRYRLSWKETKFSAVLAGHMQKIRTEQKIPLKIDPEAILYNQGIFDGTIDPATAPRIDIKISGGWFIEDQYYGIEAKIVVENNFRTRNSTQLTKDYIENGIKRFIDGKYSSGMDNGCMVGYVIEGRCNEIISKINNCLIGFNRKREIIHNISELDICVYGKSIHTRVITKKEFCLCHIFLDFNN